jgi:hypothetical protein
MITLTIDYGYDVHSIAVTASDWARIKGGEELKIEGAGFPVEGEMERDFWWFNTNGRGSLHVYCDSARDVYIGNVANILVAQNGGHCLE